MHVYWVTVINCTCFWLVFCSVTLVFHWINGLWKNSCGETTPEGVWMCQAVFIMCVDSLQQIQAYCLYFSCIWKVYSNLGAICMLHIVLCKLDWIDETKQEKHVFFFFHKNGRIKCCSSFKYLSEYRISWSHVDWCKFCIHLRNLNVWHFGTIEVTELKYMALNLPSMEWLPTKFYKYLIG
jgi:hypothetical protein